jgi:hypothetical protein
LPESICNLSNLQCYNNQFKNLLGEICDEFKLHTIPESKLNMITFVINNITLSCDDILYKGTIFDGKLIQASSNKSSYIIHDMYMCEGKLTQHLTLETKLKKVDSILSKFRPGDSHYFDCKVCRLYGFVDLPDLVFNKIKQTDLKINGIMFLPDITGKYYIYTNETEFDEIKFSGSAQITITKKSSTASEVEFFMKKTTTPDVYELYEAEQENTETHSLVKEGIAHIPNISTSHYFRNVFKDKNMVKVSCIKSEKFNKWIPLCDDYINYSEAIF